MYFKFVGIKMNIKPIHTEQDYQASLQRIEQIFENNLENNTQAQDELEVLNTLIESYEAKHYAMPEWIRRV